MSQSPTELRLTLDPTRRFEAIDVNERVARECVDLLASYPRTLYCSLHTTAGYLDQSLSARMDYRHDHVHNFFLAFKALFPPNAPYRHDQMELRAELTPEQKEVEPRNADSHLTFIGAGMRNCVTYSNKPKAPVYFIDLDGTNGPTARRRTTTILAYNEEEEVGRASIAMPVSRHPIDSVNLNDPRLGLTDLIDDLLARAGLEKGRVDLRLGPDEHGAGLTVNEYETLLMQHDLVEILRDPLKFAAIKGRHLLDDPFAIPSKTLNYARYDAVRIVNTLMEALKVDQSVIERVVAMLMAVPARRFLRSRAVSFLASDQAGEGRARLVKGTYQSPILVQWQEAPGQTRQIDVVLVRLR